MDRRWGFGGVLFLTEMFMVEIMGKVEIRAGGS
jgi:hypothetical protein